MNRRRDPFLLIGEVCMEYMRCTRCIMDTKADPEISFDSQGYCNYCNDAIAKINTTTYFPNEEGKRRLEAT